MRNNTKSEGLDGNATMLQGLIVDLLTQACTLWAHLCADAFASQSFSHSVEEQRTVLLSHFVFTYFECFSFSFPLLAILPSSFGRISVAHDCKSRLASGAYCTVATETDGRLQAH